MGRGHVWVQLGWDGRFSCQRKLTGFDGWKHPSRQSPRFVVFCMPVYAYKYIKLKEVINSYNVFTDCVCINTNMHGLYCILHKSYYTFFLFCVHTCTWTHAHILLANTRTEKNLFRKVFEVQSATVVCWTYCLVTLWTKDFAAWWLSGAIQSIPENLQLQENKKKTSRRMPVFTC